MAYLQTKDFTKNASAGDYAGKDRHSIVLFKIKDKKPFVLSATQTGPKVYGVTYDKTKKILVYKDTLASKKLKEISIISEFENSNFLKSISLATFIKIKLIFRLQYLNVYKQSNDKKRY